MGRRCLALILAPFLIPSASAARVPTAQPDAVSSFFLAAEKPASPAGSHHVGLKPPRPILLQQQQRASADNTTTIVVACVVVLVLVLGGVAVWFKRRQASATPEEGTVIEGSAPRDLTEPLNSEAAPEAPTLDDYESLFRKLAQKGAQQIGPKVAKCAEVRSIVEGKIESMKSKAKALVMSELNDAAGSVCRSLEIEESMLLLDMDAAVSANFPPASILTAGLLVPVTLTLSKISHIAQILIVLLPTMCLCLAAEYMDWNNPCLAIPGLRPWSQASGILTFVITVSRLVMFVRTTLAEKDLQAKSDEMKVRLATVEGHAAHEGRGLADIRELFICHSTMLQYAVVCESRMRKSIFNHIVGFGTLLWLFLIGWVTYLTCRYIMIPGVVAFHPAAAGDPAYCAAWMTVIAARISVVLGTLFLFVNVFTVVGWVLETSLNTPGVTSKIETKAKEVDGTMLGIPVMQFLTKSLLLRGSTDVLGARLAMAVADKSVLAKDYAETEARLAALKAEVEAKDTQMKQLAKEVDECDGTLEDQAAHFSHPSSGVDIDSLRKQGDEVIEERKRLAMRLEQATTEEIDRLVEKIRALATSIEQSESVQAAKQMAAQGYDKASASAQNAAKNIQDSDQFKQAQAGLEQAQRTLQDPELMKKAQAAGQDALTQAQGAASQASAAIQDPELMKKAQAGLEQAKQTLQDPELMQKAQAGLEQAKQTGQAGLEQAKQTLQDPELMQKAQETAQGAAEKAKAAASQAKGQAEKSMGKKK